ncbi:hypothetical protein [Bacillus sp. EB600]|uniref:hypothetical protein n=1 Tax=Bacillus sp. EB600 TaxID=2806345 RepID=UPI00210C233C|nr:hypothetical protein [Bacillus sp. EB600]
MIEELKILFRIFTTTRDAIEKFINILDPVIQNAADEHERLYYHHITEEEEQRLSRLAELFPLIASNKKKKRTTLCQPTMSLIDFYRN